MGYTYKCMYICERTIASHTRRVTEQEKGILLSIMREEHEAKRDLYVYSRDHPFAEAIQYHIPLMSYKRHLCRVTSSVSDIDIGCVVDIVNYQTGSKNHLWRRNSTHSHLHALLTDHLGAHHFETLLLPTTALRPLVGGKRVRSLSTPCSERSGAV